MVKQWNESRLKMMKNRLHQNAEITALKGWNFYRKKQAEPETAMRQQEIELRREEIRNKQEQVRNQILYNQEQLRLRQEEQRKNSQSMLQMLQQQQQILRTWWTCFITSNNFSLNLIIQKFCCNIDIRLTWYIDSFMLYILGIYRGIHQRCSRKKGVLTNLAKFTGKHLCQTLFFNKVAGQRPEACQFCKFCTSIFFMEHLWVTASGYEIVLFDSFQ